MINTPESDISVIGPVGYIPTYTLAVGTYVELRGTTYEVLRTVTHQDTPGQFTSHAQLQAVDADGEHLDVDPISVNLDTCDPRVI